MQIYYQYLEEIPYICQGKRENTQVCHNKDYVRSSTIVVLDTLSPRNSWNVMIARMRHTMEMMQPTYVMICKAVWCTGATRVAWTSISTAKLVKWSHLHMVWVRFEDSTSQPSSDHALQTYDIHINIATISCQLGTTIFSGKFISLLKRLLVRRINKYKRFMIYIGLYFDIFIESCIFAYLCLNTRRAKIRTNLSYYTIKTTWTDKIM